MRLSIILQTQQKCLGVKLSVRPRKKKKKKKVLRARLTAFFPFADFLKQKKRVKSVLFRTKNLNEKLRAKRARQNHDFKLFSGYFGTKM